MLAQVTPAPGQQVQAALAGRLPPARPCLRRNSSRSNRNMRPTCSGARLHSSSAVSKRIMAMTLLIPSPLAGEG